jgi:hypothetical protein
MQKSDEEYVPPKVAVATVPPETLPELMSMAPEQSVDPDSKDPALGDVQTSEGVKAREHGAALPEEAAVTRPLASTVIEAEVYEPAVTPLVGKSAAASALNVGCAALPDEGLANTKFAVWVASVPASVPLVVMGEPPTEKIAGSVRATLVTVPAPPLPSSIHPLDPHTYTTLFVVSV